MSLEFIDGAHEGLPASDGMRLAMSGGEVPAQGISVRADPKIVHPDPVPK